MFCWLVFGDHAQLRMSSLQGIPHFACLIRPTHDRDITHRASPWGGLHFCWLVFGDHEALRKTCAQPRMSSLLEEYYTLHVESAPRITVISPTAPSLGEAKVICWLVFGDHAALRRGVCPAANVILTKGIPHFACRTCPKHGRDITHRASPWGGLNDLVANTC